MDEQEFNEQLFKNYIKTKNFTKEEFLESDITQSYCPSDFGLSSFCNGDCASCWEFVTYKNNLKFKDDNNNDNNNKAGTKDLQDQIELLQVENLALKNILKTIIDLNTQTTKQLEMVNSIFNCQSK